MSKGEVRNEYKGLSVVLEELKQCPEARRLMPGVFEAFAGDTSEQTTTEGKESAPPRESEPKSDSEQKTG